MECDAVNHVNKTSDELRLFIRIPVLTHPVSAVMLYSTNTIHTLYSGLDDNTPISIELYKNVNESRAKQLMTIYVALAFTFKSLVPLTMCHWYYQNTFAMFTLISMELAYDVFFMNNIHDEMAIQESIYHVVHAIIRMNHVHRITRHSDGSEVDNGYHIFYTQHSQYSFISPVQFIDFSHGTQFTTIDKSFICVDLQAFMNYLHFKLTLTQHSTLTTRIAALTHAGIWKSLYTPEFISTLTLDTDTTRKVTQPLKDYIQHGVMPQLPEEPRVAKQKTQSTLLPTNLPQETMSDTTDIQSTSSPIDQFSPAKMKTKVPGLLYYPNYVSLYMEKKLLEELDDDVSGEWMTTLSRKVKHFGFYYDYMANSKNVNPTKAPPFPPYIQQLAERFVEDGIYKKIPQQCIVNEYFTGQGIGDHTDNAVFGEPVVTLSLNEDTIMNFKHNGETVPLLLERRSLATLNGDARWKWTHGISQNKTYIHPKTNKKVTKGSNYRRISVTFRSYKDY